MTLDRYQIIELSDSTYTDLSSYSKFLLLLLYHSTLPKEPSFICTVNLGWQQFMLLHKIME